jgi:hypothetical protein
MRKFLHTHTPITWAIRFVHTLFAQHVSTLNWVLENKIISRENKILSRENKIISRVNKIIPHENHVHTNTKSG